MKHYTSLEAWRTSMDLVQMTYQSLQGFPKTEQYGLVSQLTRAAVSVPANIAEGIGRRYPGEAVHFMLTARGSLYECETLAEIAHRLGFLNNELHQKMQHQINETIKLINGLIRYFRNHAFGDTHKNESPAPAIETLETPSPHPENPDNLSGKGNNE